METATVSKYQDLVMQYGTTFGVKILVGPVLAVRPYCHNDHYWQVYFDTNRTIRESFGAAGFAAPMPAQMVMMQGALDCTK